MSPSPSGEAPAVDLQALARAVADDVGRPYRRALDRAVPRALIALPTADRDAIFYAFAAPLTPNGAYPPAAIDALATEVEHLVGPDGAGPLGPDLRTAVRRWLLYHHTDLTGDGVLIPDSALPSLQRALGEVDQPPRPTDWRVLQQWAGLRRHPALAVRLAQAAAALSPTDQAQAIQATRWVVSDEDQAPAYRAALRTYPAEVLQQAGVSTSELRDPEESRGSTQPGAVQRIADLGADAAQRLIDAVERSGAVVWNFLIPSDPRSSTLAVGLASGEASGRGKGPVTLASAALTELDPSAEYDGVLRVKKVADQEVMVTLSSQSRQMSGRRFRVRLLLKQGDLEYAVEDSITLSGNEFVAGGCTFALRQSISTTEDEMTLELHPADDDA